MQTKKYIGRQIRAAREGQGWSISETARRFGVSHATMSRWESGDQAIEFADLERLAKLLEKPVQFFLPGLYFDPAGLSPEFAQLVNRLNNLPDGPVRDRVIRGFMDQIGTVEDALGGNQL
jgi:transcriptional regulator with XRE-family HTH domain